MPYTGKEKGNVRTFFTRYSRDIKQAVQTFANSNYRPPNIDEFITIVNQYVRNPVNNIAFLTAGLLTGARMQNNRDFIESFLEKAVNGINVPAQPPSPAAAPPIVRPNGAILADGSQQARDKVIDIIRLHIQDAASVVNTGGMSASTLYGSASTGVFYHHTIHSSDSTYGARDDDGIYKITCVYAKYDDYFYLVGLAKHNGTERVGGRRNPVDKYLVEKSLISDLFEGDTLHFR